MKIAGTTKKKVSNQATAQLKTQAPSVRGGSNKSCLEVNLDHAEIMKVPNRLQAGDVKQKARKGEGTQFCTAAPTAPELWASVEEVTCVYFTLLLFSQPILPHH